MSRRSYSGFWLLSFFGRGAGSHGGGEGAAVSRGDEAVTATGLGSNPVVDDSIAELGHKLEISVVSDFQSGRTKSELLALFTGHNYGVEDSFDKGIHWPKRSEFVFNVNDHFCAAGIKFTDISTEYLLPPEYLRSPEYLKSRTASKRKIDTSSNILRVNLLHADATIVILSDQSDVSNLKLIEQSFLYKPNSPVFFIKINRPIGTSIEDAVVESFGYYENEAHYSGGVPCKLSMSKSKLADIAETMFGNIAGCIVAAHKLDTPDKVTGWYDMITYFSEGNLEPHKTESGKKGFAW